MKSSSIAVSKGPSPPKSKVVSQAQPPISAKKPGQRSDSKNSKAHQQSFERDGDSE
jgi:hypothetical protein